MKKIVVLFIILASLASCAGLKINSPVQLGRLSDGTLVVFQDKKLYTISPDRGLSTQDLDCDDFVLDGDRMAMIRKGQAIEIRYTNHSVLTQPFAKGFSIDKGKNTWLVQDKKYLNVYSNDYQVNFYSLEEPFKKGSIWNNRFLISQKDDSLKIWDLRQDGSVTLKQVITNVQDFVLHDEQPLVFLIQHSNQILSYMIYANQLTTLDTLPFPVDTMDYAPQARTLIVRNKGVTLLYHQDNGSIEMLQFPLQDISYDVSRNEILLLSNQTLQILNMESKEKLQSYKLNQ